MTILCDNEKERVAVESQVKILIRPLYSNPSIHGARIATEILSNPNYYQKWLVNISSVIFLFHQFIRLLSLRIVEMKNMADRISSMRVALKDSLAQNGTS